MLSTLRHLALTLSALAENRLRLLGIEMEEQAGRLAVICAGAVGAIGAVFMALAAVVGIVLLSVPPDDRLMVFFWVFGLAVLAAILLLILVVSALKSMKSAFSQSIRELQRDSQLISTKEH